MADCNNRVIYPEEVDKLKQEAARKRRQIHAETNCNAIYFSDECEESQPTEAPEIEVPEEEAPEKEAPEEEEAEEETIQEETKKTNKASNSNAIVFPDEENM